MACFIAEFCQNHNGDFSILQEMVHAAAEAGATHGKIQSIFADDLVYRERFEEGKREGVHIEVIRRPYQSEYDRLKKLELSMEQHHRFIDMCHEYGLIPMTTCFSRGRVSALAALPWSTVKVASYDCASLPLIRDLAQKFRTVILSTGASTDDEIRQAAELLQKMGVDFVLLHCVTIYPTPLHQFHLRRMNFLRQFCGRVGLSDHSLVVLDGVKASLVALYFGAEWIERHFTILDSDKTKDGPVSIRRDHMKLLVDFSKWSHGSQKLYLQEHFPDYEMVLGKENRALSHQEELNRDYYRGRFGTRVGDRMLFNWEDERLG